jgi:integrase
MPSTYRNTRHANLRRRMPSGEFVLWAKVHGKLRRVPLGTAVETIAVTLRNEKLKALRAVKSANLVEDVTMFSALTSYNDRIQKSPVKTDATKRFNAMQIAGMLRLMGPKDEPSSMMNQSIRSVSAKALEDWFVSYKAAPAYNPFIKAQPDGKSRSAGTYNHARRILKSIFKEAQKNTIRADNPMESVERFPVVANSRTYPPLEKFWEVVQQIKNNTRGGHHQDSADLVRFLTFGGFRLNEANHIAWSDVNEEEGFILVRQVKFLTLGAKPRMVPIIPAMKSLLTEMKTRRCPDEVMVLRISECETTLTMACRKVGIERLTHHSLRHYFATICIESGVDIPTVAGWLGHRDGGALLMKTYHHLRNQHSLSSGSKVSFGESEFAPDNVVPLVPLQITAAEDSVPSLASGSSGAAR